MSDDANLPPLFVLMKEIGIIEQLSRNRLERVLPNGLTSSQFRLLNHLARLQGDWSPARLAAAFQVTKAALTNTVGKLEKQGMVQVEPDPKDQRGKLVRITGKGIETRNECIRRLEPSMQEVGAILSQKDIDTIMPVLVRLRSYLDDNR